MNADALSGTAAPGDPYPPPGLVVVGHFDRPAGYAVQRPGGCDSWLFTWTTGGHGRLRQGGAEARAGAGDLVVLAPGVRHGYGVAPGAGHWRFWWAHCRARPSWTPWLRPYGTGDGMYVVTPVPGVLHGRIEAVFARMRADARWTGSGAPPGSTPGDDRVAVAHGGAARELALCSLEETVLLATSAARPPAAASDVDERVSRAMELMVSDPGHPHTVRSLAHGALARTRCARSRAVRRSRRRGSRTFSPGNSAGRPCGPCARRG